MEHIKKIGRFLFSMRFALLLLSILLVVCLIGSFLPQNEAESFYMSNYPEKIGLLILLIGLDNTFHCPLFLVLSGLLCLNLLGCNLIHLPALIRNWKSGFNPVTMISYSNAKMEPIAVISNPEPVIHAAGFRHTQTGTTVDGHRYLYSVCNKIGLAGAWLTHLGILIIILGFTLGQIFMEQSIVYGVPGQTKSIGDTPYSLTINSFDIGLREDETVTQYTSNVTLSDISAGTSQSADISVNHPAHLYGMKLYQNSTGWASRVVIFHGDEQIQSQIVCAGESIAVKDFEDLVILFRSFYPDYFVGANGMPASASSSLNNPAYLYSAYYQGQMIGMNILTDGDYITIDDYTVIFDEPQNYTLIQLKRDPFTWLTLVGGIVICISLIFAFYTNTAEILAVEDSDDKWMFFLRSKKSELLLTEKVLDIIHSNNM